MVALAAYEGPKLIYGEGWAPGAAPLKRESIVFQRVRHETKMS